MEEEGRTSCTSFEKSWSLLKKDVKKFITLIEDKGVVIDHTSFSIQDYMSIYKSVYDLRSMLDISPKLLWDNYKKLFAKYINSKVLPSLQEKENEVLLRELVNRWSSHKIMTRWLSRLFGSLETFDLAKSMEHSLEEIGFLSFYDLVYEKVNKKVIEAILAMVDEDRAGKQIDKKLVNNILALYLEIGEKTGKIDPKYFAENIIKENAILFSEEASNWIATLSLSNNTPKEQKLNSLSKQIKLMSCDGDIFEVDYDVALMSKTLEDVIEIYPNIEDSIPLLSINSKILGKIIEYCKKHKEEFDISIPYLDVEFFDVDTETVFDLILSSNYLNIKSLREMACLKVANMIKGKSACEIGEFFEKEKKYLERKKS